MGKYDYYTLYDKPVLFKGLEIYPILMKDYWEFVQLAPILLIDIYSMSDTKILSMKYLEYLFYEKDEDGEQHYLPILAQLLRVVLRKKDEEITKIESDGNPYLWVGSEGEKVVLDKNDFEEVRDIIIEQNLLSPPNYKIEKSLRDSMEEARQIRKRMHGSDEAGIEDQVVALMDETGISLDDIFSMTYRKFSKALERADHTLHYKIYLAASMSGMVTFKDKSFVKHWLSEIKKNEFSELLEYNSVEKTINSGNTL